MAHKVETMAYNRREVPWHGLGMPVDDSVTPQKMLVAAGLNWGVDTAPVEFRVTPKGEPRKWGKDLDHHVMYRTDTGAPLDIVGNRYQPVQNAEVLEFFQEYVHAGEAVLETAGSLQGGKYIWALARMGDEFNAGGRGAQEDTVRQYVLLMNPHQYGKGMILKRTDVRTVCWNTLTAALKDGNADIRLWHNRAFDARAQDEAKRRLGIARDQFKAFKKEVKILTETEVTEEKAVILLNRIWAGPEAEKVTDRELLTRRPARALELFLGEGAGSRLSSASGTAWGLLNAVTEYMDHEYGRSQENRLSHVWLGGGEKVKRDAKALLLELAGVPSGN